MKDMLALLGAALVVFAGLGWYLGWYQVGTSTDSQGNRHIELDLNAKKIGSDISRAGQTIGNKLSSTETPHPTSDPNVVPTSGTVDPKNKGFGSITVNSDGVQFKPNIPNLPFSNNQPPRQ